MKDEKSRQELPDFDRGVVAGLSQAAAICSDREDMTAERLKVEIEDLIRLQVISSHEHESMAGRQKKDGDSPLL